MRVQTKWTQRINCSHGPTLAFSGKFRSYFGPASRLAGEHGTSCLSSIDVLEGASAGRCPNDWEISLHAYNICHHRLPRIRIGAGDFLDNRPAPPAHPRHTQQRRVHLVWNAGMAAAGSRLASAAIAAQRGPPDLYAQVH